MSSPFRPSGIYSAQWLPTDSGGALDRAALATHLAFEKTAGVAGFLTALLPGWPPDGADDAAREAARVAAAADAADARGQGFAAGPDPAAGAGDRPHQD